MPEDINKFDQSLKSVMENAQEEVPSRVWDAVSGRLDRKPRTVILKRIFTYSAIAAALVVGALVSMPLLKDKDVSHDNIALTSKSANKPVESVQEPAENNGDEALAMAEPTKVENKRTAISRHSATMAQSPVEASGTLSKEQSNTSTEDNTVESADHSEVQVPVQAQSPKSQESVTSKSSDKESQESYEDPFAKMEYEDRMASNHVKVSFVVNGQLESNGDPNNNLNLGPLKINNPSAPTKTTLTELSESTFGVPISFGVGTRIKLSKHWAIGAGMNYSLLTRTFTGTYTKVKNDVIVRTITADVNNQQHFIGIPINAFYNIVNNDIINVYAFGGGTVEKCFRDHNIIKAEPKNLIYNASVKGVQLSAAAGFGVQFRIIDGLGIYVDPSLRYYFDCDQPKSIRTQQPMMFNFEAGLRIDL
jgi:hypothetical protein